MKAQGKKTKEKGLETSRTSIVLAFTALISLTLLTSCNAKIIKKKEFTCREFQLQYDYHNGEATLWSARDKRSKAEAEMMEVVKIVMGHPGCFPEKIIQDIQFYYTTLPGVTKYNDPQEPSE